MEQTRCVRSSNLWTSSTTADRCEGFRIYDKNFMSSGADLGTADRRAIYLGKNQFINARASRSGPPDASHGHHRPRGWHQMTPIAPPAGGFAGPVKRSITIAGHETSITLEPVFWRALEQAARRRALPLSALVAEIDALRVVAADPPNLASALRTWLITDCENHSH